MVAPNGTPRPSASTMILVPLPRLVLPTSSPLFLPGRTCRRRRTLRGSLGPADPACAAVATTPSPRRRCGSTPGSDASKWREKETKEAGLANALRCATPRECLPGSASLRWQVGRLGRSAHRSGISRRSVAIGHPLARIWAPSWTPPGARPVARGIEITSVVSFLTTGTKSTTQTFSYHQRILKPVLGIRHSLQCWAVAADIAKR
jgi:hypothetical protein